jgi:hypothetical protein
MWEAISGATESSSTSSATTLLAGLLAGRLEVAGILAETGFSRLAFGFSFLAVTLLLDFNAIDS